MDLSELTVGTKVQLKKPHPCGSFQWEIVRTGADLKLKCLGCGRFVFLPPDEAKRRTVKIVGEKENI